VHVGLQLGETNYQVELGANCVAALPTRDMDGSVVVFSGGDSYAFTDSKLVTQAGGPASSGNISSPMPGRIVAVSVKPGDRVAKGQPLVTLEAMKIEHTLTAPFKGTVTAVSALEGHQVSEGVVLAQIDAGE
jgi:3-methylcrotonyl-CoA carboxylase alpha subunit